MQKIIGIIWDYIEKAYQHFVEKKRDVKVLCYSSSYKREIIYEPSQDKYSSEVYIGLYFVNWLVGHKQWMVWGSVKRNNKRFSLKSVKGN